ncbi:hypothetical protein AALM51_10245 [Enterobacter roggenkampii]|uniref:hypothetical protein n=1 Tax=Enterobacter roggenkampii TaxID=1812935 RepID=UPI0035159D60
MSNIDKRALREAAEKAGTDNHTQDEWFHYLRSSTPATVLALLDELEAAEKRIAELPGPKRLIGWRMADYTDETADPALAKNWATAVDVLPIFEGDVNTKLSAAAADKGE